MPYPKVNWQNGEAGGTPLNATNLNIMDNGIKANEDAIIQNTADIEELKNKPSSALVLTSASPLINTTEANILGIDVSGKSEQKTVIDTVQGNITNRTVGSPITQVADGSANRCTSNVVYLPSGTKITVTSGYKIYILYSSTATGNIEYISNAWFTDFTTSVSAYYRIIVCETDSKNLTPSSFVLSIAPTPAKPIPIVDASAEVVAIGKNLFDKSIQPIKSYIEGNYNRLSENAFANTFVVPIKTNTTYTVSSVVKDGSRLRIASAPTEMTSGALVNIARGSTSSALTITTQSSDAYLYVNIKDGTDIASIVDGLQIEEGTTATDYVPYQSNSITLPITLRSVGTIADTLVINKDGSGKLTQRVDKKTLNGSGAAWSLSSWGNQTNTVCFFYGDGDTVNLGNDIVCAISPQLLGTTRNVVATTDAEGICISSTNSITIRLLKSRISGWSDADSTTDKIAKLNSYLASNPIDVQYVKASELITDLTAEQVSSILALRTYNGTTIIDSELDVQSVTYSGDVKAYVEEASASMALNSTKVTRNIPSMEAGDVIYTIATPTGFPYSENFKYKAYIVQAGAFIPFRLNSVTCTSTYISVSVTFPDGTSGAGTLELLLYWDEYKPIDVAPAAMVMSIDEGGAAE